VNSDNAIENYGLNAVCTHLGCVVPWVGVSTASWDAFGGARLARQQQQLQQCSM
jgi:Rieske Fe-S protein